MTNKGLHKIDYHVNNTNNIISIELEYLSKTIGAFCIEPPTCKKFTLMPSVKTMGVNKELRGHTYTLKIKSSTYSKEKLLRIQIKIKGGVNDYTELIEIPKKNSYTFFQSIINFNYSLVLLLIGFTFFSPCAQEPYDSNKEVQFEIEHLNNNGNPAATLLGISADQIQSIKQPTDFTAHVASSTNQLTEIPRQIGMEFFPYHIINDYTSIEDLASNKIEKNIWQSLGFSVASVFSDSEEEQPSLKDFSLGLRFSILRGESKDVEDNYEKAKEILLNTKVDPQNEVIINIISKNNERITDLINDIDRYDEIISDLNSRTQLTDDDLIILKGYQELRSSVILAVNELITSNSDLSRQSNNISNEINGQLSEKDLNKLDGYTSAIFENLEKRSGFKLDFSAAYSRQNFSNSVDSTQNERVALWLVGSHEIKEFDLLLIGRYQNYSDFMFSNSQNLLDTGMFDFGSKISYDKNRFTGEAEFIYRNYFEQIYPSHDKKSQRWLFDLGYDIGNNTLISLTYGREFDGEDIQGGNLISALNFVKGFGSKRRIN